MLKLGSFLFSSEVVKKSLAPEVKLNSGVKQKMFLSQNLRGRRQAEQGRQRIGSV